jgi:hypothetical protein
LIRRQESLSFTVFKNITELENIINSYYDPAPEKLELAE